MNWFNFDDSLIVNLKMKILICSKLFYPSDRIGAVRPSNFAKYLADFGHDVTVVTESDILENDFNLHGVKIIRVSNRSLIKKILNKNTERIKQNRDRIKSADISKNINKSSNNSLKSKIKELFIKNRMSVFNLCVEYDWYKSAKQIISKLYFRNSFDIVISSFGPLSSFLLGRSISKVNFANYWISDFRDNMVFNFHPAWLNKLLSICERTAVKHAHALTFVSLGQKKIFVNNNNITDEQAKKIHVIYNGYEKEFLEKKLNKKENRLLRFTYTGQLYNGVRDFTLFFDAINNLIEEKKINKEFIRIEYAGPSSNELRQQSNEFHNLEGIIFDNGIVSRERSLEMQNESDFLIALTWNTQKERGILTGKFLEYLQAQKPIISLTSGNVANGELTEMINEMNLGIACEYINYKLELIKLQEYLLQQYNSFIYSGIIEFSPKYDRINNFHYKTIVKELERIILNISQKSFIS